MKFTKFNLAITLLMILILLGLIFSKDSFEKCNTQFGKDKWIEYWSNTNCGHLSPCIVGCKSNITQEVLIW